MTLNKTAMKVVTLLLFIISGVTISAQSSINVELKQELIKIEKDDQDLRRLFFYPKIFEAKSDSLQKAYGLEGSKLKDALSNRMKENDSINLVKIESIIEKHGYPGKSLVGQYQSDVAWAVIQHSGEEIIGKYLHILKSAADNDELSFTAYALSLDRYLMYNDKPQIYGTQGNKVKLKGIEDLQTIIWPIENPDGVNKLRKKVGFPQTVKKYAKSIGIKYKVYSMDDLILSEK